jgi:hypothetical protein
VVECVDCVYQCPRQNIIAWYQSDFLNLIRDFYLTLISKKSFGFTVFYALGRNVSTKYDFPLGNS